jgi:RNA polymerase sigma-70 factor (ECF subfamily)
VDHLRGQPKTPFASIEGFDHLPEHRAERSLERVLTHFELAGALSYLTEGQRRVVSLRCLQGLSLDETTQILGKSEDAVKKLQARGLQALKKVMKTSSKALVAA